MCYGKIHGTGDRNGVVEHKLELSCGTEVRDCWI